MHNDSLAPTHDWQEHLIIAGLSTEFTELIPTHADIKLITGFEIYSTVQSLIAA